MKIHHVFGHQDRSKDNFLALQAKLNIKVDKIISANTRKPLQTNIINTPMAIYLKKEYIPNKYHIEIRSQEGAKATRKFMMGKYKVYVQTCENIKWELQAKFIQQQTYSKKKTMKKYIHQWLTFRKKNYEQPLMCTY